jgi:hypothetical protein
VAISLTCLRWKQKKHFQQTLLLAAMRKRRYGRGGGVGRGLGDGMDLGDGVGLGVAVGVAVGVVVGVGVGVGVAPAAGPWMSTVIGDPVLKNPTVALAVSGG